MEKDLKFLVILLGIFLILPVSAVEISNTTIHATGSDYKVYPNTTVNMSKLVVETNAIKVYNLTGGGNFTNIGVTNTVLILFGLVEPYKNVRYNNLTFEVLGVSDISVLITPAELIEVFYGISPTTSVTQQIIKGSTGIKTDKVNITPYVISIGALALLCFIFLVALAEGWDRRRKKKLQSQ
jgi:hypothetical protein